MNTNRTLKIVLLCISFLSTPQNGSAILRGPRTFHPKNSPCSFSGAPIFYPKNSPCSFSGAPISGMLVYLVPLARSRYCASPEASIMRLKAAATLGASGERPYRTGGRRTAYFSRMPTTTRSVAKCRRYDSSDSSRIVQKPSECRRHDSLDS